MTIPFSLRALASIILPYNPFKGVIYNVIYLTSLCSYKQCAIHLSNRITRGELTEIIEILSIYIYIWGVLLVPWGGLTTPGQRPPLDREKYPALRHGWTPLGNPCWTARLIISGVELADWQCFKQNKVKIHGCGRSISSGRDLNDTKWRQYRMAPFFKWYLKNCIWNKLCRMKVSCLEKNITEMTLILKKTP